MEKEKYKQFFNYLKSEGLLIDQIDEESFDEYIFENFKPVLPQADVIKLVCNGKDIRCDNPSMDRNGNCRNCEGDMQTVL